MASEVMFLTEHEHILQLSVTDSKVKWPLSFAFGYFQLITQCYKQRTGGEVPVHTF